MDIDRLLYWMDEYNIRQELFDRMCDHGYDHVLQWLMETAFDHAESQRIINYYQEVSLSVWLQE